MPLEAVSSPIVDNSTLFPEDCWEPEPPPTDLIFDDGEPLETNRHRLAMNVLIDGVNQALTDRTDFFAGGNMFVYFSDRQVFNKDFRGPDFFIALDIEGTHSRQGWVVWQEQGRYPDVIIELLSPSTKNIDLGVKKDLYERTFHTQNYFVYDPFDPGSLQGWQLRAQRYEPIAPNDRGWLWCDALQLWLGPWTGQLRREPATGDCDWLRFYSATGDLIPLQEDLAAEAQQQAELAQQQAELAQQRAELAEQRAIQLEAQLRALGIEPQG